MPWRPLLRSPSPTFTTGGTLLDWRLILDADLPGHENMARDSSILKALEEGFCVPTVRIYGWDSPAISIGYLQNPAQFLGLGMPVVRRITGGRAVVHSSEVTYSVAGLVDDPLFCGGIMDAYSVISRCIIAALSDIGVEAAYSPGSIGRDRNEACFHSPSRYEVLTDGRKLVGSAQRRLKRAFLQHGSILMATNEELNERVFGKSLAKRMAGVSEFSPAPREELRGHLAKRFAEGFNARFSEGALTAREAALKEGLKARCLLSSCLETAAEGDGRD